jgi:V8-like Glu-specific endopeptidase
MKIVTISEFFFALTLLTSVVSFGTNSACPAQQGNAELRKLLAASKKVALETGDQAARPIPDDPRSILIRKDNPEYNPIGIVKTDIGRGSGWLGNECLVWTNKHVIGADKKIIGKKVTFYVGQSSTPNRNFEYAVEGEVVASGNPNLERETDDTTQDWALIKLKTSVGKKVGFIQTSQYSVDDATTCKNLEIAGFPGEKSVHDLWWQGKCPLYKNTSGVDAFNLGCPITPGNSGSPLLCRETDGKLYAIGIATQALRANPDKESFAVNFTADWARINAAYMKYMNSCPKEIVPN